VNWLKFAHVKPLILALSLGLAMQAAAAAQSAVVRSFEEDKVGAPPLGFSLAAGRDAASDRWTVKREGNVRVLSHEGNTAPPDSFAVAIHSGAQYTAVQVSTRLKATGGARVAGLVWKYQDAANYYVAQLDLVRQEVAMYRVSGGNRIRLEQEDDLELDPDAWHSLKIRLEDGRMRVYLGGIRVLNERDRDPSKPASVGIWAGGDTTVMFDDFRIEDKTVQAPRAPSAPAKP